MLAKQWLQLSAGASCGNTKQHSVYRVRGIASHLIKHDTMLHCDPRLIQLYILRLRGDRNVAALIRRSVLVASIDAEVSGVTNRSGESLQHSSPRCQLSSSVRMAREAKKD